VTTACETLSPHLLPAQELPTLRQTRFEDYPQIASLETSHELITLAEDDWRRVWTDNPLWPRLKEHWPIGWVLEDNRGKIVGSLGNVPFHYTFQGKSLISACGRGWVVAPEYRGVALWLMDEYFNQDGADLFVNTTVNALAAGIVGSLSARVPAGDWQAAAFWVTSYHGFARTALRMKDIPMTGLLAPAAALGLRLKDLVSSKALPPANQAFAIAEASGFDPRFDVFWKQLVEQNPNKLLAVRDVATLNWHFSIPMRHEKVWIITASQHGILRAYCTLKREDQPAGLQGLTRMRLVDFQTLEPEADLLPSLLRPALHRCRVEGIHVLEHMGCDLPKMAAFDRFAPHRRKLQCWKFYSKATDPAIDVQLASAQAWDPSTYDGDATID